MNTTTHVTESRRCDDRHNRRYAREVILRVYGPHCTRLPDGLRSKLQRDASCADVAPGQAVVMSSLSADRSWSYGADDNPFIVVRWNMPAAKPSQIIDAETAERWASERAVLVRHRVAVMVVDAEYRAGLETDARSATRVAEWCAGRAIQGAKSATRYAQRLEELEAELEAEIAVEMATILAVAPSEIAEHSAKHPDDQVSERAIKAALSQALRFANAHATQGFGWAKPVVTPEQVEAEDES